jgi:hypothetical protein
MIVKVINLKNTGDDFEVDYETTTVGDLATQVMTKYAYDPELFVTVKLIYNGTVLNPTEKLSAYIPDAAGVRIISLPQKKPGKPVAAPAPAPTPAPTPASAPEVPATGTAAYSVDQVHATCIVLLQFIRSHPVLSFLFMHNMSQLQTILLDSGFKDVIRQILAQSNALISGMASGHNVPIQIQGFNLGQPAAVPSSLIGPTGISTQASIPDDEEFPLGTIMQNIMGALGGGGSTSSGDGSDPDISALATAPLTPEDNANIQQLVGLGFTEHRAKTAYLQCGKNLEVAASLLFEQSGLH